MTAVATRPNQAEATRPAQAEAKQTKPAATGKLKMYELVFHQFVGGKQRPTQERLLCFTIEQAEALAAEMHESRNPFGIARSEYFVLEIEANVVGSGDFPAGANAK
jgi:hypothetical protein